MCEKKNAMGAFWGAPLGATCIHSKSQPKQRVNPLLLSASLTGIFPSALAGIIGDYMGELLLCSIQITISHSDTWGVPDTIKISLFSAVVRDLRIPMKYAWLELMEGKSTQEGLLKLETTSVEIFENCCVMLETNRAAALVFADIRGMVARLPAISSTARNDIITFCLVHGAHKEHFLQTLTQDIEQALRNAKLTHRPDRMRVVRNATQHFPIAWDAQTILKILNQDLILTPHGSEIYNSITDVPGSKYIYPAACLEWVNPTAWKENRDMVGRTHDNWRSI